MNGNELQKIEKRTVSYWFEDGVYDIALGLAFVILGASYFALEAVQKITWLAEFAGLIQIVLLIAIFLVITNLVKKVKAKLIYPRTGEVVYKKRTPSARFVRGMRAGALSFIFASAFAIFALIPKMHQVLPAIVGALFALSFMILGWRVGVLRYFIVGTVIFIIGLVVAFITQPFINQTGVLFLAIGLTIAVAGGIGLMTYLKNNPLNHAEEEQG